MDRHDVLQTRGSSCREGGGRSRRQPACRDFDLDFTVLAADCRGAVLAPAWRRLGRNVLPPVPIRQWVLSLPRRGRFLAARYLAQRVVAIARELLSARRERLAAAGLLGPDGAGASCAMAQQGRARRAAEGLRPSA